MSELYKLQTIVKHSSETWIGNNARSCLYRRSDSLQRSRLTGSGSITHEQEGLPSMEQKVKRRPVVIDSNMSPMHSVGSSLPSV